jgi:hypothetical protein
MKDDDCFFTFQHRGIERIRELAERSLFLMSEDEKRPGLQPIVVSHGIATEMLSHVPSASVLDFDPFLTRILRSSPGTYYPPHKDAATMRFGLNYLIREPVVNNCLTTWYSDEDMERFPQDYKYRGPHLVSRDLLVPRDHGVTPIASRVFTEKDGAILIDTDFNHSFDMQNSIGERYMLIFRTRNEVTFRRALDILMWEVL